eukprot:GEMP01037284.1.p1 GENE.GEMP01037284.1~~GEMP01037284.1.p1  ORF type:complete len:197 (+),score=16.56 GEMP01037284.1:55-591(+)
MQYSSYGVNEDDEPLKGLVNKLRDVAVCPLVRHYLKTKGTPRVACLWSKLELLFPFFDYFKFIPQGAVASKMISTGASQCSSLCNTCSSIERRVAVSVPVVVRPLVAMGMRFSAIVRPIGDFCERQCRTWILQVLDADLRVRTEITGTRLRRIERSYVLHVSSNGPSSNESFSDGEKS